MTTIAPPSRSLWHGMGWCQLVVLLAVCSGCALAVRQEAITPTAADAPTRTCQAWYAALDAATSAAGARDAAAAPVPGYPHLRVDRFSASLRDRLPASPLAATAAAVHRALTSRLLSLDLEARGFEIQNLPHSARLRLAESVPGDAEPHALLRKTRLCGALLLQAALARPGATHAMLARLAVPDDYVAAYRVLGLYPLTRIPFLIGVRQFESRVSAAFRSATPADSNGLRLRLRPPWRPAPDQVTTEQLRAMLRPPADDPLAVPAPSDAQLDILFAHFAPILDVGQASNDDRPGALVWPDPQAGSTAGTPIVDTNMPVLYRQVAFTRHGNASLLQLVYTVWFGARSATTQPIDLLAGRLDGLVWRVTLSPDGVPLVYDSIHPCGCYHQFFAQPWIQPRPAPDPQAEWAFSPARAPALQPGQQLVLRLASATHYLQALELATADAHADTSYAWRAHDTLRSLPIPDGTRRSVFDARGFIPGTDRGEAWLFWPMGIARAGAMRQWGRHATAFVGRRHFDDAHLIEQRFVLQAPPTDH